MKRQRGFSIFAIIFFICIIAVITKIALIVIPPYMDFLTLADATRQTLEQPRIGLMMNTKILEKVANQLSINNIHLKDYGPDAMTLSRFEGNIIADIDYTIDQQIYEDEDVDMYVSMHFARRVEVKASNE